MKKKVIYSLLVVIAALLSALLAMRIQRQDVYVSVTRTDDYATLRDYGNLVVPYHYNPFDVPPQSDGGSGILFGHLEGRGVVRSIAFSTSYYGVAVGYEVDGQGFHWINNGACLYEWGGNSPLAVVAPVYLSKWEDYRNLSIMVNTPIFFEESFKLYFGSSSGQMERVTGLHIYIYTDGLIAGDGNRLLGVR